MLAEFEYQQTDADARNLFTTLVLADETRPNQELEILLADLSPEIPWGNRQLAAKKIGSMQNPESLPVLLAALPVDPFWMVRCDIIQAIEKIRDPGAIPTLRKVAQNDGFQIVRSYADKAVERLSQGGGCL